MITLSILNQKGGVAKTTTAVTLAHGLAKLGNRVLLVDLDAQGNVSDALGLDKGPGLYSLLVLEAGRDAVQASGRENLDVVRSDKTTAELKQLLAGRAFREQALKKALAGLASDYDWCVIDSAPGADVLQINALIACDVFLIPVALDHLAVVGASDALATVSSLKEAGGLGGDFLGVLPTLWERRTKESHEQLMILANEFTKWVWPPIPQDVKAREAPAHGETLWEYAPKCRAMAGVELNGRQVGGYVSVLSRLQEEV